MAAPLTADRLLAALKAEGVRVAEHDGWRTHNRNHVGPWGGMNGVVIHHTAGVDSLALCYDGTPDLPGPLCHTHLAKDGTATMISAGRANHAGSFAQNAHDAVVDESSTHPRPDASEPVDGNQHYYGLEIENLGDGKDPYPAVQYEAAVRWATAICRAHGWTEQSVIGHKEGTRRKIDPSFDMTAFRAKVAELLAHPAGHTDHQEDDDMATADEIARAVWEHKISNRYRPDENGNPTSMPARALQAAEDGHYDQVVARLDALTSRMDALASAGLTAEQLRAAAEAGARAALATLGETLTEGA